MAKGTSRRQNCCQAVKRKLRLTSIRSGGTVRSD